MSPKVAIDRYRLAEMCRRFRVAELALFGSVMRDDFRPDSDVDVLVTFAPGARASLFDLVDLQAELQALLGRKVDLVEKPALRNPFRRRAILREAEVVYAAS
ncbi:MAG: nucleotidyltransferase family protein [bacterium]